MGAVNSCCIPRKTCDCGTGTRTSTQKGKGHRRNLSDTFNMSVLENSSHKVGGVNINLATEEEFMTLPGISRAIAKNIIDHRSKIGGFRCIEDLALASGVGAERLSHIRQDIYVMNIPNGTQSGSFTSVSTQTRDTSYGDLINVNSASFSDLVKIKRIGTTLAENIVDHRNKNGKFSSIEDLSNVKGIGPATLQQIKRYLTVEGQNSFSHNKSNNPSPVLANGKIGGNFPLDSTHNPHPSHTSSIENMMDLLGPSEVPERPVIENVSLKIKNQPVVRIATWNLEEFGLAKAKHPGVKDVVCMTILENSLGIIAFQELTNKDALTEICNELNHPTLPNVKKWKKRRGKWKCVVSKEVGRMFQGMEYSGFLFDASWNIELITSSVLEKADNTSTGFTRKPFMAAFKINDAFDCILVSVHLKATGLRKEDIKRTQAETDRITDIIKCIRKQVKDENDVIILGDFNLDADASDFNPLRKAGYMNCISATSMTNIGKNNPDGTKSYDNIWVGKQTRQVLACDEGHVVRQGLWSPWIPCDWGWGGYVSNHCPVFTQLYTSTDLDNGNIVYAKDVQFTIGSKAV